ncbi:MAG TPA: D-hexose-6-phosphate mutarotase [Tepidisphaeraceae bacterium]|jgi:glucose-6-phosphate 1-epimerase|nr:D-hexose-6-phosphate mutarotase [Tepidisphaeraceae bacterium]
MLKIEQLQQKFGVEGAVRIEAGRGSLPKIVVATDLGSAEIYLFGAQVAQFQPRGAAPVLFLSRSSFFDGRKPIRGGIPLVFPWFGPRADLPESPPHGFARTRDWEIESCDARADGSVRIVLASGGDDATMRLWPHSFSLRFIVIVSRTLDATLEVRNISKGDVRFEDALHTYLAVGDVRSISVEGLDGADYVDRADGEKRKKEQAKVIGLTGETDRLYYSTAMKVMVRDPALKRSIIVEKEHSGATVVWNPWSEKSAQMKDMGPDEWQSMVCVETANARDCAVQLPANATHRMSARIGVAAL